MSRGPRPLVEAIRPQVDSALAAVYALPDEERFARLRGVIAERVARSGYTHPDGADAIVDSALRRLAYRAARSGRTCPKCGETKPVGAYGVDGQQRDGLRRYCRECARQVTADHRARARITRWALY